MKTEAYQSVLECEDIVEALKYQRRLSEAEGIGKGLTQSMAKSIAKFIKEGIAKGIEEGEERKAVEVTLNAKNRGLSVEEIADLTNLTVKQVQDILQKHNNR
jgi:uncharacterized protein (DUF433 family)